MAWVAAAATVAAAGINAYSQNQAAKAAAKGSSQQSEPWGPQQEYLKYGFEQAKDAYGNAIANPGYTGPWTPGINNNLQSGWDRSADFSNGGLWNGGQAMVDAGYAGLGAIPGSMANAQNLYGYAGQDPTQTTINRAGQYADNPYTQNVIDASLRDIDRGLSQSLGQNNANYVATGGMNSTRAGVAEAMLKTSAMDRAGDIAAGIRNQNYTAGLNLAANQYQQGIQNRLGANSQYAQAGLQAGNLLGTGLNIQGSAIDRQTGTGMQQYQVGQQEIQGNLQGANYADNRDLGLASKYMNIVGGQQFGSNTFTQQPYQGPSALQAGLGGGMQMYGLMNQMGYNPFGQNYTAQKQAVTSSYQPGGYSTVDSSWGV